MIQGAFILLCKKAKFEKASFLHFLEQQIEGRYGLVGRPPAHLPSSPEHSAAWFRCGRRGAHTESAWFTSCSGPGKASVSQIQFSWEAEKLALVSTVGPESCLLFPITFLCLWGSEAGSPSGSAGRIRIREVPEPALP